MNYIINNEDFKEKLLGRFIKYVKIWSESDGNAADKGIFPSTDRQWDFARILKAELNELGLSEVQLTESCYVYGVLPASKGMEEKPSFLVLSHLDTVDEVTGKDVNPKVFRDYDGQEINLSCGVRHSIKEDRFLAKAAQNKETIITTDGTTLLGADDKAGVSAIMTALDYLISHPELKHCKIEVIFSPDEETGHGMDKVPLNLIKSKRAYTVDGGEIGEMETECFNAFAANVNFTGKACHTGDARENKMVNAAVMASRFIASLPHTMTPETTDGYDPFIAPMEINGSIETASVSLLLRAFTMEEIEKEKKIILSQAEAAALTAGGKAEVEFKQQYLNMKAEMDKNPFVVQELEKAFRRAEVEPVRKPIRGGTDGSRLTEMGLPTPNIFTGAHNFHSRNEWCSLNQMAKATEIIINLGISD